MARFIRTTYIVEKASSFKYFQPHYWRHKCSALENKFIGEEGESKRSSVHSAAQSQMNLGSTLRPSIVRRESLFASTTLPAQNERRVFHDLAATRLLSYLGIKKRDSDEQAHRSANTSMADSRGASTIAQSRTTARRHHSKDSSHVGMSTIFIW